MSTTTPRDAAAETQNVLAMMTSAVNERKTERAAKLTPVQNEVVPTHKSIVPDNAPATFPNDHPREVILEAIDGLEREKTKLDEVIAALRALVDAPADEPVVDLAAERRARERAADEAHEQKTDERVSTPETEAIIERMADLKVQAEAATFEGDGWVCPDHGSFVLKFTRLDREYRACPDCRQFERI